MNEALGELRWDLAAASTALVSCKRTLGVRCSQKPGPLRENSPRSGAARKEMDMSVTSYFAAILPCRSCGRGVKVGATAHHRDFGEAVTFYFDPQGGATLDALVGSSDGTGDTFECHEHSDACRRVSATLPQQEPTPTAATQE